MIEFPLNKTTKLIAKTRFTFREANDLRGNVIHVKKGDEFLVSSTRRNQKETLKICIVKPHEKMHNLYPFTIEQIEELFIKQEKSSDAD